MVNFLSVATLITWLVLVWFSFIFVKSVKNLILKWLVGLVLSLFLSFSLVVTLLLIMGL